MTDLIVTAGWVLFLVNGGLVVWHWLLVRRMRRLNAVLFNLAVANFLLHARPLFASWSARIPVPIQVTIKPQWFTELGVPTGGKAQDT